MGLLKDYPWTEFKVVGIILTFAIIITQGILQQLKGVALDWNILIFQIILGLVILFFLSLVLTWFLNGVKGE